jgi:hypothetical protein
MTDKQTTGKRGGVILTCKCNYCGKEFQRAVSKAISKNQYCCRRCQWDSYKLRIMSDKRKKINSESKLGEKNYRWNGGKRITGGGYIAVYKPEHPNCNKSKGVYEHRLIMEKFLGRYLLRAEIVRHKNKNKQDNRVENLVLFENNKEHLKHHKTLRMGVLKCQEIL